MSAAVSFPPVPATSTALAQRILVAGGPRVGKSTVAAAIGEALGSPVRNTDTLRHTCDWSEASRVASTWFEDDGPWVIEGVAIPRALRKWLARNPEGKPADVIYWSDAARVERTPGQEAMAKGCATVWKEVRAELVKRGVRVECF